MMTLEYQVLTWLFKHAYMVKFMFVQWLKKNAELIADSTDQAEWVTV